MLDLHETPAIEDLHRTDLGNAGRFVHQHGTLLRYAPPWEAWLIWDGTRWVRDETQQILRFARATVRQMYRDAAQMEDRTARTDLAKWAIGSESKARLLAMIQLAQSEPGMPVTIEDLDSNEYLFNCQNGTIDLRTGQLYRQRHDDLITKRVDITYDPEAQCPHWERFLNRIFNEDQELIAYIQRSVGYTLTGSTDEQCLFFAYGMGRNGKSTFFEVLLRMLGEYGQKAPTEMIMQKKHDGGISNDVARLGGIRLVVTAEIEEGRRLSESLVKDLTGGDTIAARFLYKETFEFTPTHKLWLYGNHRPEIKGTDPGIWRRIRVVPFSVQIPAEEVDPKLKFKLAAELPGILAWAVRGCLEHQKHGLGEPEAVKRATQAYRTEMDVLAAFIADCCVVKPNATVKSADLYKAYVKWCEENGEREVSQRRLGQKLDERGFDRVRAGMAMSWIRLGIGLLSPDDTPTDPTDPTDPISGKSIMRQKTAEIPGNSNLGSVGSVGSTADSDSPPLGRENPTVVSTTETTTAQWFAQQIAELRPHIADNPMALSHWQAEYRKGSAALKDILPALCAKREWDYEETLAYLDFSTQALEEDNQ